MTEAKQPIKDRPREEVARERDAKIPLHGRMGTVWDVAYAALPVDGGRGCRVG